MSTNNTKYEKEEQGTRPECGNDIMAIHIMAIDKVGGDSNN